MGSCAHRRSGTQIDAPGDEVVGIGTALRIGLQSPWATGKDYCRPRRGHGSPRRTDRRVVVMAEVAGDPRPLGHPVQPHAAACPVDVVPADRGIDGPVEFDAGHLGTREQLPDMDVMDGVAGDGTEHRAQTSHDAHLFTIGDLVVAHHVVADGLLVPTILQAAFDGPDIALAPILNFDPAASPYFPRVIPEHVE